MAVDMATPTLSTILVRLDPTAVAPHDHYTIIAVSDGRQWSALCRELDIASDGDTADEAARNVAAAVQEALQVAAEQHVQAGVPVPDSELVTFMGGHVGPEPVSTYVFSLPH